MEYFKDFNNCQRYYGVYCKISYAKGYICYIRNYSRVGHFVEYMLDGRLHFYKGKSVFYKNVGYTREKFYIHGKESNDSNGYQSIEYVDNVIKQIQWIENGVRYIYHIDYDIIFYHGESICPSNPLYNKILAKFSRILDGK